MTKRLYIREAIDLLHGTGDPIEPGRFEIPDDPPVRIEPNGAWVTVELWIPKPKLTSDNLITELAEIDLDTDEEHALLAEFKRKARVLTGLVVPRKED